MTVKNTLSTKTRRPAARRDKQVAVSTTVYRVSEGDPANPQGDREFLLTEPLPLAQDKESWISKTLGPGRYRIEDRDSKGRILSVDSVLIGAVSGARVEDDYDDELEIVDRTNSNATSAYSTPPVSSGASITELVAALKSLDELRVRQEARASDPAPDFLAQLRALEEARKLLMPTKTENTTQPSQPDVSVEAAILRLIREDRIALSEVTSRLLGANGDETPGWLQMLSPLVRAVADNFGLIAQAALMLIPSRDPGTAQPPPKDGRPNPQADPYSELFGEVLSAIGLNSDPGLVVRRIEAFLALNPVYDEPLLHFLGSAPAELIQTIAQIPGASHLAQMPHVPDWIARLQTQLFREDGDESKEDSTKKTAEQEVAPANP